MQSPDRRAIAAEDKKSSIERNQSGSAAATMAIDDQCGKDCQRKKAELETHS